MKNVFLVLFVMMGMAVGNQLQAQTTCTPAQKEACQKLVEAGKCSPAQAAACQKAATTVDAKAVKVVNQAPTKKASCNKPCDTKNAANMPISPVKLVGLEEIEQQKKACQKPCEAKKPNEKG